MAEPVANRAHGARRIRSPDMLSAKLKRDLARASRDHGDGRARDRLLLAFVLSTVSIARRLDRGERKPAPDLIRQADIGPMKAAVRFDPARDSLGRSAPVQRFETEALVNRRRSLTPHSKGVDFARRSTAPAPPDRQGRHRGRK